ncbi:MAG TPA: TlpA disulfide reductase family protein [Micropepsaceae bacterium]|jgi:thiol-disulfide isomerase/thioredoxin|nr:TlpA disulfide reductase family protein [Micropepsaceae bacterium]
MKPRTRLFATLAAGLATVALGAVLYGIIGRDVHATARPPAVLDKLKLTDGRPPAPDIGFLDAMGKPLKLADFHGRYVLVNLWATWCGPCINELPELARLQKELPQDRITVVPVDVLEKLDAAKLAEFLTMHQAAGLPVFIDRDRATQRGFIANELPLTVLIDAEGREVARAAGGQKWDDPASAAYLKAISAPKSP